jgi:hypothetical protein
VNPGSNLFLRAIRLIKPTTVQYLKFSGRTQNAARQWVAAFETAVPIQASVQAVARSSYTDMGLDFQKNYIKIFAAANLVNIKRDSSGDRFIYNGMLYQIEDQNTWFLLDGWASCIAVEVGVAP